MIKSSHDALKIYGAPKISIETIALNHSVIRPKSHPKIRGLCLILGNRNFWDTTVKISWRFVIFFHCVNCCV